MRKLIASLAVPVLLMTTDASAFELISAQQYQKLQQSAASEQQIERLEKSLDLNASAPRIELLQPDIEADALSSPFEIELRSTPSTGANIDLGSLKITYGWFNITDKIMQNAEVTESGILAKDAEIPAGRHTIKVEIKDSLNRKARRKFSFTVAK